MSTSTSRITRRTTVAPRTASVSGVVSGRAGVSAIGREMRAKLSQMVSNVMLNAADAVEAECPIRTGHLLSNFILSTGAPHDGVEGSPQDVSYAAQDAGREKVLNYDVGRDGKIYFTNHVEYLKYQRPFVTEALMSAVSSTPAGHQARARSMLKALARTAFKKGA